MRGALIGVFASLVAIVGIAGSANANATVDLIWANSGTSSTSVAASTSTITLNVFLKAGSEGARAAAITVDYSDQPGSLLVVGITNNPNMPSPTSMLPLVLGSTIDTGSRVQNLTAEVFPPFVRTGLMSGESWLIGTVTFVTTSTAVGTFSISSMVMEADDILDLTGASISAGTEFGSAIVNIIPEPGTVALLGLGLLGLALVGRQNG